MKLLKLIPILIIFAACEKNEPLGPLAKHTGDPYNQSAYLKDTIKVEYMSGKTEGGHYFWRSSPKTIESTDSFCHSFKTIRRQKLEIDVDGKALVKVRINDSTVAKGKGYAAFDLNKNNSKY